MTLKKLGQMAHVTEAVYLSEFQKVQPILEREAKLRREIAQLQMQSKEGSQHLQNDQSMQSVGADLLWQAWLARTHRQLNMELSQVVAKKMTAMDKLRKAFGRKTAVATMLENQQQERLKDRNKKAFDRMMQVQLPR